MNMPGLTAEAALYKTGRVYCGNYGAVAAVATRGVVPSQGDPPDPCGCCSALGSCVLTACGPTAALCVASGFNPALCTPLGGCLLGCQWKWAFCEFNCSTPPPGFYGPQLCCPPGMRCSCGGRCVNLKGGGQACLDLVAGEAGQCLPHGAQCR
jgi:hypothetical protein